MKFIGRGEAFLPKRPDSDQTLKTKKARILMRAFRIMVPGLGIEPRTRGFSIRYRSYTHQLNQSLTVFAQKL
jgi:aminopeptidase C